MNEIIIQNKLSVEEFIYLYNSTGWDALPPHQIEQALHNDRCHISAWINNKIVGMGRLVGDGAMYWYIQNLIILPQYQSIGVGTAIMNYFLAYIQDNSPLDSHITVGLMCSEHSAPFYQKFSFDIRPCKDLGPGATLEFKL